MTLSEIYKALNQNLEVNWCNSLYIIHKVKADYENTYAKDAYKDGYALRITCKSNYFGSFAHITELKKCFINVKKLDF